ncbi:MAG TPA: glycosyltransferase [Pyrinomonadaceae bacterium]|jgi:glycosyltransferase involved in cell wall biosynthesis|nr:glycosyltransferase [Pyrinomonadaceae bacterium]
MSATHTLYLSYFGLREPLVQTQVLPYLRQLSQTGMRVSLLTFEPQTETKWTAAEEAQAREQLAREGIFWHQRAYHKSPSLPATLYDVAVGARLARELVRREGVNILHARGHVPALMAALVKRFENSVRMIFDIRGFMPEEYTDGGVWPADGYLYRGVKKVERFLFASSDAFVVLTEKARDILFPGCKDVDSKGRPIEVIPCCVDFERFAVTPSRESVRAQLNLSGRRVIVYVGSFGGWYMTDEMTNFLAQAHKQNPATFSMILTQSPRQMVSDRMSSLGIEQKDFSVAKVSPQDVPRYLLAADVAISFIKPCYSKQSSSPTKIAEYLASGLPIVCNAGVGDLDKLITEKHAGALLREFTPQAYRQALDEIDVMRSEDNLAERLRAVARQEFDLLSIGRTRYRRLYERLLEGIPATTEAQCIA